MDARQMRDNLQRIIVELNRFARDLDEELTNADEKARQDAERQRIYHEVQREMFGAQDSQNAPIEEVSMLGEAQPTNKPQTQPEVRRAQPTSSKRNDDK